MIEVVRNAVTVHQIQKRAGIKSALQLDSSQLFKWIRDNNRPSDGKKDRFVDKIQYWQKSVTPG